MCVQNMRDYKYVVVPYPNATTNTKLTGLPLGGHRDPIE